VARLVLHIAADFPNQEIYPRLVRSLSDRGVKQVILSAVRTTVEADRSQPQIPSVRYDIRHVLKPAHRIFFRTKIRLVAGIASRLPEIGGVSVVHAHSLYSDGAVALTLARRLSVPFVTAVRNVDVNAFMRLRPDLVLVRNAVLRVASRVVFLSPAYRDSFISRLCGPLRDLVSAKSLVIPNGVAPFWHDHESSQRLPAPDGTLRLLYVGDFTLNKNIHGIIAAVGILASSRKVALTIVGGDLADAYAAGLPQSVAGATLIYAGRATDVEQLRQFYLRHDVFVMPSFTETFGVAYIEALSQGLPVVHSLGQGIEGYFPESGVAQGVDPSDPVAIAAGIAELASRVPRVGRKCVEESRRFNWEAIGLRYEGVYEEVIKCRSAKMQFR
jgi:L-malate glycosyltransferase